MAYDDELVERLRAALARQGGVTEKKMFGGLAFLVDGHMAVAANRSGALMARVDPADSDALIASAHVERMVMRGREMRGWLRVDMATVDDAELSEWVERGVRTAARA